MSFQTFVNQITTLHSDAIIQWKKDGVTLSQEGFLKLVEENHQFNYLLWHAEDQARRDDKGFEYVYKAKREIDHYNQQRNNRMEAMDEWLTQEIEPVSHQDAPVNSETPGMMIDRLSILALKSYHMKLQTERMDVEETHRKLCLNKLLVIEEQLNQLQSCLEELLDQCMQKVRTFRVYHQFKMYNDPNLNPELYHHKSD